MEKTAAAFDTVAELTGLDTSALARERIRLVARSGQEGYGKPVSSVKR